MHQREKSKIVRKVKNILLQMKKNCRITDFLLFDGTEEQDPFVYICYVTRGQFRTCALLSIGGNTQMDQNMPVFTVGKRDTSEKLEKEILQNLN